MTNAQTTTDTGPLPKPLHDYVILRLSRGRKTASGLHIPDSAQPEAVVVAVGPGLYELGTLIPVGVNVGDLVVLTANSQVEALSWRGETLAITRVCHVCCVLPCPDPGAPVVRPPMELVQ